MRFKLLPLLFIGFLIALIACTYQNEVDLLKPESTITGIIPTTPGTNTDTIPTIVSLQNHVLPIFDKYSCRDGSCHGGSSTSGGVYLGNYKGIAISANNGQLYKSIAHLNGASPMPSRSEIMNTVQLATVKKWIDNGALDN